jgi:hypothetical protein
MNLIHLLAVMTFADAKLLKANNTEGLCECPERQLPAALQRFLIARARFPCSGRKPSRLRIGLSSRCPHTSMVFGFAPVPQIGD